MVLDICSKTGVQPSIFIKRTFGCNIDEFKNYIEAQVQEMKRREIEETKRLIELISKIR
jgi:hypothetical protein